MKKTNHINNLLLINRKKEKNYKSHKPTNTKTTTISQKNE